MCTAPQAFNMVACRHAKARHRHKTVAGNHFKKSLLQDRPNPRHKLAEILHILTLLQQTNAKTSCNLNIILKRQIKRAAIHRLKRHRIITHTIRMQSIRIINRRRRTRRRQRRQIHRSNNHLIRRILIPNNKMLLIRRLMQRQIRITVNSTARRIHQIVCTVINNLLVKNRVQNPNEFLTRQKLATLNRVTGVNNLCVLTCFGQLISDRDNRFGHSISLPGQPMKVTSIRTYYAQ